MNSSFAPLQIPLKQVFSKWRGGGVGCFPPQFLGADEKCQCRPQADRAVAEGVG